MNANHTIKQKWVDWVVWWMYHAVVMEWSAARLAVQFTDDMPNHHQHTEECNQTISIQPEQFQMDADNAIGGFRKAWGVWWLYSNAVVIKQSPIRLAVQVTVVDAPHHHQQTAECWKSLSINSLIQSWWTLIAPLSLYGWIWWSGGCTMLLWWIDLLQNWQFNAWLTCHITTNIQQSAV